MGLVPRKPEGTITRTIGVTKTFLLARQGPTLSFWVKVSPRHPLLQDNHRTAYARGDADSGAADARIHHACGYSTGGSMETQRR